MKCVLSQTFTPDMGMSSQHKCHVNKGVSYQSMLGLKLDTNSLYRKQPY